MKKILLSAVAVMAFGFANAQESTGAGFSQGDVFITGSVGFGNEKTGDNKTNTFNFSPKAGYFVTSNIAVGVQLGVTSTKETVDTPLGDIENKETALEVGAFGRYYFTPTRNFSFFGQLSAGYVSNKVENDGDPEYKENGVNIALAPGISYFVSDHIALEATFGILGYRTLKPDVDGADSTNTFNVGANFSDINFGMVYKF